MGCADTASCSHSEKDKKIDTANGRHDGGLLQSEDYVRLCIYSAHALWGLMTRSVASRPLGQVGPWPDLKYAKSGQVGPDRARSGLVRSGQVHILDTCLCCITCFRNQILITSVIGLITDARSAMRPCYILPMFFKIFFMPALVGQTAERIFTKLSHVVDIRCYLRTY